MAKIKQIFAREILNSKGIPTVEVTVLLNDDIHETASAPSGTSTGTYEAVELRDRDEKRYEGKGVLKAIKNIETIIAPALIGQDPTDQAAIDKKMIEMDGTQNKGLLGANAILPVSMAVAKVGAKSLVQPLYVYLRRFMKEENLPYTIPTPLFNLINGGKHAGNNLDFQEYIVVPATSTSYSESLHLGTKIYSALKNILIQRRLTILVGDEGGFGPALASNLDAFALLQLAVESINLRPGFDVFFGLDAAANNFYKEHQYTLKDRTMPYSPSELGVYYKEMNKQFPILYMEDPFYEDGWEDWEKVSNQIEGNTIVVGDDLTVTNPYRLQMAITKKTIGGVIIKPNQIGSVIEALAVVQVARLSGLKIIVSHRSGETNDDFIADFGVAVAADYIKFGSPARGERVAKYNRLLQIEKQLQTLEK